jgi:ABC-type transport system involved in cytochrome bd biosynthesis fused ATPase/permease subunit
VILAAQAVTALVPQSMHVTKAASAADSLFRTIDRESLIDPLSESGERPADCKGHIEVEEVHFNYPTRPDVKVLQGLNITIPANKTTALVGASGSGKSTIVGLLERWYNPLSGNILLDGKRIEEFNVAWLRSNIRMVQQVRYRCGLFEQSGLHPLPGTRTLYGLHLPERFLRLGRHRMGAYFRSRSSEASGGSLQSRICP